MNTDQAIKRILWRFKECEIIYVNEKDVTAVNEIIDYINKKQAETFLDNIHFSKLYVYVLGIFLEKYETTIDQNIPTTELHKLIDKPLEYFIEDITSKTNFRLKANLLEASGIKKAMHPALIQKDEMEKCLSKMQNLIQIDTNKKILYGNAWSISEIRDGLRKQIINYLDGIR